MSEPADLDRGIAGRSARHQYEQRKSRRESKTREAHPRIGGLLLKLQDGPRSEKAWERGAVGEEAVAAQLARRSPDVVVLHDRKMPGSRANIDHLAISPSGVLVIDAKSYKGKIEVRRPLIGDPKLMIAGRDKTTLVEGLQRQVDAVRVGLAIVEQDVPIGGCFCFISPDGQGGGRGLPLFGALRISGFPLYSPRKLSKRLNQQGPVTAQQTSILTEALVELFPTT